MHYTNYCSHYWHLCVKDSLYQPAKFVVDDMLCLRKRSVARRYTLIFFTFAVSGILHLWLDLTLGVPFRDSGSMFFFLSQAVAIMLEDAVIYTWKACTGLASKDVAVGSNTGWKTWIGRLWVGIVLLSTTSAWTAPMIRHAGQSAMVPFSVVKVLKASAENGFNIM